MRYLEGLNEPQREAVLHEGGSLLILAGAGSGKTRVITVKIAHLIRSGLVGARSILAVTFTNKAANEMQTRATLLAPEAADTMIRTFHSFGAWLLRRNAALLDLSSTFTIYDDDDAVTLLRSLYPNRNRADLSRVSKLISRAKDYALSPDDDLTSISPDPDFPDVYAAYRNRIREIGNVDFGDLIIRPMELLERHPEVRERIRSRFRVILVDEYQDSNVAQFRLLRALAGPDTYVCVVGDDDQSIYRFRGAEVRNILTFHETFPGTTTIRLEENYRSTEPILQLASAVVRNNRSRLGKELWTRRSEGPRPRLALLPGSEEEVAFCVDLIRTSPRMETAILYRTNAQSRAFETTFMRLGIPYRIVGTLRFYEREEVKDAVALLKFAANPRDEVAFRRIVNKPSRGLGTKTVDAIVAGARGHGDLAAGARDAQLPPKARKALGSFLDAMSPLLSLPATGEEGRLSELVESVLHSSGLVDYHRTRDEIAGSQKEANLEELVNAAALYPASLDALAEFLEAVELDSTRESESAGDAAVVLITMHNTKGLEFQRVVVTGLEDGLFPRDGDAGDDDLEEERRLFYVALTRAKDELYLTSCRYRRLRGRIAELAPSRFLREIPEDLIDFLGDSRRQLGRSGFGDGATPGDDENPFPPGTGVYHENYGTGVVARAWYSGDELVVSVQFESGRTAKFVPRYTRLERIALDD